MQKYILKITIRFRIHLDYIKVFWGKLNDILLSHTKRNLDNDYC